MLTRLKLENWKNFREVDVPLQRRVFIVGPNASGKSNLLEALRFLRDVAAPQGGLQRAVAEHGGSISLIRSLHARQHSDVAIEVELTTGEKDAWTYRLELSQDNQRNPIVKQEVVRKGDRVLLSRPSADDKGDPSLLRETHLEHLGSNKSFRQIAEFLASIRYAHLVPQLVRDPNRSAGRKHDPFGGDFLEQLASTPPRTLNSRLRRIKDALSVAVPQLKDLKLERDEHTGIPHVTLLYKHWRPNAGWQDEQAFSDGTLRLLGLLWFLLDGSAPLLLEEPELSLHPGVVQVLPQLMHRLSRKSRRQVLVSTHSPDMLSDPGISGEEVLMLTPSKDGTRVESPASKADLRALLASGISVGEIVIPRTRPHNMSQLALFE